MIVKTNKLKKWNNIFLKGVEGTIVGITGHNECGKKIFESRTINSKHPKQINNCTLILRFV